MSTISGLGPRIILTNIKSSQIVWFERRKVTETKSRGNRRYETRRIAHLNPGTWVDRLCIGLQLKRHGLKIFLILALIAMLFSQAECSDQF